MPLPSTTFFIYRPLPRAAKRSEKNKRILTKDVRINPVYWTYDTAQAQEITVKIIDINERNLDSEHICCAIGNDAANKARAQTKKEWLKGQFTAGLTFRRLDARGKVFIEYMPIETAWKPLIGANYLVINCLWVSGQFKGKGHAAALLTECVEDARKRK